MTQPQFAWCFWTPERRCKHLLQAQQLSAAVLCAALATPPGGTTMLHGASNEQCQCRIRNCVHPLAMQPWMLRLPNPTAAAQ